MALCEVQSYVMRPAGPGPSWPRHWVDAGPGRRSERQAEQLRERFEAAFWCDDLGTYVLALDGEKRPCRVRSSNAGQCLFGGIASPGRAVRVAARAHGP